MLNRRTPLARVTPLRRGEPLATVTILTGGGKVLPLARPKRPKDTIPANIRRIVTERDMGLCVYTGKPATHIHHRRLKGMGGSSDAHANCLCNLVLLDSGAHEYMHKNRFIALAEGVIIPAATVAPWLLPVLVHGRDDGSGVRVWPTCDGEWLTYEPDGGSAA